jgi:hypothetical protein
MNERIKELAGQAKFMAEEDINKQISYNTELKAFAEKFAELIVGDCAEVLLKWKGEPFPFDEDVAVRLIKENFGFKE